MRCTDGCHYVVKFLNNSQHARVLVNDWLGTRLAGMIGLSVPVVTIVHVGQDLIARTPDLRVEIGRRRNMFTSGPCFGSRYVVSPFEGQVYDYLPESMMDRSAQRAGVCWHLGFRQVDVQRRWTTSGLLEAQPGTQVHCQFHRSGILLLTRRARVRELILDFKNAGAQSLSQLA